jgi:hypothetical protein
MGAIGDNPILRTFIDEADGEPEVADGEPEVVDGEPDVVDVTSDDGPYDVDVSSDGEFDFEPANSGNESSSDADERDALLSSIEERYLQGGGAAGILALMQEQEVATAQKKVNSLLGTDNNPVVNAATGALAAAGIVAAPETAAAVAGIGLLNKIRKIQQNKANEEHKSDPTAQKAARALLEQFYRENVNDLDLDAKKTFIGIKNGEEQTYETVAAGLEDEAKFIRWNVKNLKNGRKYIKDQLRGKLNELSQDEELAEGRLIAHAEAGSINVNVKRHPETLVAISENTQVKELLALNQANVSTHDGEKHPVDQLVFDGNGQVHGDLIDHHFYAKDGNGNNPNNSINLLVQLANGDASLILGSAHDLLRSTKGYTDGDHPATSFYVHSKDGFLDDRKTPIPKDDPYNVAMMRDAMLYQRYPIERDGTVLYNPAGSPQILGGGKKHHSVYTPIDTPRKENLELVMRSTLKFKIRERDRIEALSQRDKRSNEKKQQDLMQVAKLTDEIEDLQRELDEITDAEESNSDESDEEDTAAVERMQKRTARASDK